VINFRTRIQIWIMRALARSSSLSVCALPAERLEWIQPKSLRKRLVVIPIGSNMRGGSHRTGAAGDERRIIAVFTVTEGGKEEASRLGRIAGAAAKIVGPLRLIVMGRGAPEAESFIRDSLAGSPVELIVRGILTPDEVSDVLGQSAVQLYIRSGISTCRGAVVAGVCCGLPIAGWKDWDTAFPITEAGIRTVPAGEEEGLVQALVEILQNPSLRASLGAKSQSAAERFYRWDAIADRFLSMLRPTPEMRTERRND
jgi:hypothetical protein